MTKIDFNDILFKNDIMDIIGSYVKEDRRKKEELFKAVEETNEKIKKCAIDILDEWNLNKWNYKSLLFNGNVWSDCCDIIENIEHIDKKKVNKYYFEKGYLREILDNVRYEKIYLDVKYKDKEDAKILGAKWDNENKSWYGYLWQKKLMKTYKK